MSAARGSTPPEDTQAREATLSRWVSIVAALISLGAAGVSCLSLSEQREANEQQQLANEQQKDGNEEQARANEEQKRVNDEARAEKQSEFASLVSWWERGGQLYLQNLSSVPIRDAEIRYRADFADEARDQEDPNRSVIHDGPPMIVYRTIPPCTLIAINGRTLQELYLGPRENRPNGTGMLNMYWMRVDFTDGHGRWSIESGGTPEPETPRDSAEFIEEGTLTLSDFANLRDTNWIVEQRISGCGA